MSPFWLTLVPVIAATSGAAAAVFARPGPSIVSAVQHLAAGVVFAAAAAEILPDLINGPGRAGGARPTRPATPCALYRCTQSRSVWRCIPALSAASVRLRPSITRAIARQRRAWFASRLRRASCRRSAAVRSVRVIARVIALLQLRQPETRNHLKLTPSPKRSLIAAPLVSVRGYLNDLSTRSTSSDDISHSFWKLATTARMNLSCRASA
jgi:hypothetical protein